MRNPHQSIRRTSFVAAALVAVAVTALAGCSASPGPAPSGSGSPGPQSIVLVTHDSFALSAGILDDFTKQTGISVTIDNVGDAGELVNKLILTKDSPLGDVTFGIDNTFATRASAAGVLEPYVSGALTAAEDQYRLPGAAGQDLTPIDTGDVCVNVDHRWFAAHGIPEPTTLDDLIAPAYKNLLVVEGADTSSPGLAFLLATIAAKPDGWQDYWKALMANGVEVAGDWDTAYYSDFSGPSSTGDRPLVVSYSTSPPAEVTDVTQTPPTGVLADTCFVDTEYAGVLAGTQHPDAAKAFIDFLLSPEVQQDVPGSMYVYPVVPGTPLPDTWKVATADIAQPYDLDPADIDANRDQWIAAWSAIAQP